MVYPFAGIRTLALMGALAVMSSAIRAEEQFVYPLQRLPAGTIVVDAKADHWNHLILLSKPVLTSGNIDRIPAGLEQSVTRFSYAILATVAKSRLGPVPRPPDSSNPADSRYLLAEVGLGYCTPVQGRQVIVTSSAEDANLGMIDRRVLSQSESNLETARVVVRSSTLMMFDLAVLMDRQDGHREERVRNLIWIDPQTGKSAMAAWIVQQGRDGGSDVSLTVSNDAIEIYPGGSRVANRLHVDGSSFVLGIPTAKTFASEHLPRSRQVPWTDKLHEFAGRSNYSRETLAKLSAALNEAIQATQSGSGATP